MKIEKIIMVDKEVVLNNGDKITPDDMIFIGTDDNNSDKIMFAKGVQPVSYIGLDCSNTDEITIDQYKFLRITPENIAGIPVHYRIYKIIENTAEILLNHRMCEIRENIDEFIFNNKYKKDNVSEHIKINFYWNK